MEQTAVPTSRLKLQLKFTLDYHTIPHPAAELAKKRVLKEIRTICETDLRVCGKDNRIKKLEILEYDDFSD
ncbi:hypothetical protein TNCT_144671 [Trichonephila clavata]|uniref:Uncharacterized protein n=1 Tax=Trichonephila clavata TaxID=2740835 RepID=A0A8X6LEV3_TRICU|nr:hypothetical protein TNCT_144671 [Trichonephila clavata]